MKSFRISQARYIYELHRNNQNTLLFHEIQSGRAHLKGIRISYAVSTRNAHPPIISVEQRNTPLLHDIETGRAILKSCRISWASSSTHHPSPLEHTRHNTLFFLCKPIPPRLPHRDDNTHRSPRRLARQLTLVPSTRQLPPSHTHA